MRDAFVVLGSAALAAAVLAGCSKTPAPAPAPAPERACTMIGCDDGLLVEIAGSPAVPYRVEVRVDGEETRVQECPDAGSCAHLFFAGLVPATATVEVIAASGRTSHTVHTEVETLQPNGPGCPPTCRQARVTVPWPG